MFHSEFRFFFKSTNTGCKYGDVLAAFWGRTLLAMVCRNQDLTIGTRVLEMGSLSRPIQHRYFCACMQLCRFTEERENPIVKRVTDYCQKF
jgi:hypothetical protein